MMAVWFYESLRGIGAIHPYSGLVFFLLLPGVFVCGLILMPLGVWLRWRLLQRKHELPVEYPQIDLKSPVLQRGLLLIAALTLVNVLLMGVSSYKGVEYMDSQKFCGQTCHSVMDPEYTAYQNSPHSRVECVGCHIGPGASWFVKSKLSGVRQVFAVAFKTYSRPIPSPVKELRPARETCEQCHWPQRFSGDKFHRAAEVRSTTRRTRRMTTVLVLKIGGRISSGAIGIHGRHIDATERIEYVSTDETAAGDSARPLPGRRGEDGGVHLDGPEGDARRAREGARDGRWTASTATTGRRTPSSCPSARSTAGSTVGLVSRDLPFVKKKAVELLRADYASRSVATGEDRRRAHGVLQDAVPGGLPGSPRRGGIRRRGGSGHLPPQRLSRHEDHLGDLPEQPRARGLPRLLPLPRREPRRVRREGDRRRLRHLP